LSTHRAAKFFSNSFIIAVTHYGLAEFPNRWHKSYKKVLRSLNFAHTVVALNPRIKNALKEYLPKPKVIVSSNGTNFNPAYSVQKLNKLICVGKVEERKRQFELFSSIKDKDLEVDFVGEIVDVRVKKLIASSKSAEKSFKGPYQREKLETVLPNYKALILLSEGEADALVLYEAQAAGLPIIVSREALGDQNANLPWVKILDHDAAADKILEVIENLNVLSGEIKEYSKNNYSWETRNSRLLSEIVSALESK
jgi:glycosyltransferase involved in cell wall biosynthesis